MRHELEVIKKKAILAMNCTTNEKATVCLLDIIKLSEACLEAMDSVDTNIASITLDTHRVTTDIY